MPPPLLRPCLIRVASIPGTLPAAGGVILGIAMLAAAGGARAAGSMELVLRADGAVAQDVQVQSNLDDAHSCALAGLPGKEQTLTLAFNKRQSDGLLGPSDFAFSLSIAGIAGRAWDETHPSTMIQVSIGNRRFVGLPVLDPGFHLRVSTDPDGRSGTFSAHHLLGPPADPVRARTGAQSETPTGAQGGAQSGVQTGVQTGAPAGGPANAPATGQPNGSAGDPAIGQSAAIDVDGSWRCVPNPEEPGSDPPPETTGRDGADGPQAAAEPADILAEPASDPAAASPTMSGPLTMNIRPPSPPIGEIAPEPVQPPLPPPHRPDRDGDRDRDREVGHFRLYHAGPCYRSSCRSWTATDLRSHKTSRVTVRFGHLRLAPKLIAWAEAGLIELWITGETTHGGRRAVQISALRLDGVVPRPADALAQQPRL